MKITQQFRVVRRPKEVVSRYAIIVVHNNGLPYQPRTTFYHELQPRLSLKIEAARLHQEVESLVFYAASPGVSSVTVYPSCSRRRTDCRATMVRSRSSK